MKPSCEELEARVLERLNDECLKPQQTGGDLVKLGKGLIPGANLWYAKAALDHMIFNQLQEYFSPGYLNKVEQRSRKEFNQTYWWRPQDVTPE